jgi:phage protein D
MAGELVAARPTIKVDNRSVASLESGLLDLEIIEQIGGVGRCELNLNNLGSTGGAADFLYFDRRQLDFGKTLEILYDDKRLFKGTIMGLEGHFPNGEAPTITVLADDALQPLRVNRRTRTFNDMNDGDIIRQVARDHSLTVEMTATGQTHKALAQMNQSDLAFVLDRCLAVGVDCWVEDKKLLCKARAEWGRPVANLKYGAQLLEFTALADLSAQRKHVTITGWDTSAKQSISEQADSACLNAETSGLTSGVSLLGSLSALEELTHTAPFSSAEAKTQAESYFRMSARRFVTGRGLAQGNPDIHVGRMITLDKIGKLFDGDYALVEVRHIYDMVLGFRTEFHVERPGIKA